MAERRSTPFVVGVDGGTTKTIALVADAQGNILGAGRGGNSNWTGPDVEIPMAVVVETVQQALAQAGIAGQEVELGVFCLAGADWPEDHTRREAFLSRAGIARRVIVKNDAFAGLRAGTQRPYGVVIVAGTGTNTAVITPDGREWAFGYYATYGGGTDIGWEAFEACLREDDGRGPKTALTPMVLQKLGFPTVEAMLRAQVAGQLSRRQLGALCPLVFEAAYAGDQVAAEILVRQGLALAEYVTAIVRRFGLAELEFEVVLSGSVFKGRGPLLVDTITQAVHRVAPRARIVRAELEPALGAVLLAYDALGLRVLPQVYDNLRRTAPPPAFFSTEATPSCPGC